MVHVTSFLIGHCLNASRFTNIVDTSESFEVPNMTQKQLDVASLEEFTAVHWEPNQVTCQLHERFSLIVKRYNHEIYILLRSGSKVIKLPCVIFDAICNSQLSVAYLARRLEEFTGELEAEVVWLCSYCGASYMSEADGILHEVREHTTEKSDYCFHANFMEQCDDKCDPDYRAGVNDF